MVEPLQIYCRRQFSDHKIISISTVSTRVVSRSDEDVYTSLIVLYVYFWFKWNHTFVLFTNGLHSHPPMFFLIIDVCPSSGFLHRWWPVLRWILRFSYTPKQGSDKVVTIVPRHFVCEVRTLRSPNVTVHRCPGHHSCSRPLGPSKPLYSNLLTFSDYYSTTKTIHKLLVTYLDISSLNPTPSTGTLQSL